MSAINQAWWAEVRPYLHIEEYTREGGSTNPRCRIELRAPASEWPRLLGVWMPCVKCGRAIHPIRERKGGSPYFAAACPLNVNVACSRSRAAAEEYKSIVTALV